MNAENETSGDDKINQLLIGHSAAMMQLRAMIRKVAASDAAVMITGPTGSGKEVVARALHMASGRGGTPVVAVNCGAIPAELIESELFGHERGSFTGAIAPRDGRFIQAGRGTLFLDEVGDMPLAMQVRLLRVLEERRIERVGGNRAYPVTCRIVCATNSDIEAAVAEGRFRTDLFYRLSVFPLNVPPLAARVEDVPLLIAHFLSTVAAEERPIFTAGALARLMAHDWPGNVRELRNMVDRAKLFFAARPVESGDVAMLLPAVHDRRHLLAAPAEGDDSIVDLRATMAAIERRHIAAALAAAHGVVADAARMLGMNRTTLLEKMRRHDLARPTPGDDQSIALHAAAISASQSCARVNSAAT